MGRNKDGGWDKWEGGMELHRCRGGASEEGKVIRMEEGINGKVGWNYIDIDEGYVDMGRK